MMKKPEHLPREVEIGANTPLRLNVAAALAYPDGSMTASGLRREAARGALSSNEPRASITRRSLRSKK
jgi:hypothetical protein